MHRRRLLFLVCAALAAIPPDSLAQRAGRTYPIMQPDWETRQEWFASHRAAPRSAIDPRLQSRLLGSMSLLSHIQYTPAERDQSSCGNCWAWAGTGVMEVDLDDYKVTRVAIDEEKIKVKKIKRAEDGE